MKELTTEQLNLILQQTNETLDRIKEKLGNDYIFVETMKLNDLKKHVIEELKSRGEWE